MLLTERSLRKLIKTVIIENYRKVLKEDEGNFQLKLGQQSQYKNAPISLGNNSELNLDEFGLEDANQHLRDSEEIDNTDVSYGTDPNDKLSDDELMKIYGFFIDDTFDSVSATFFRTNDELDEIINKYDGYQTVKNMYDEDEWNALNSTGQIAYNLEMYMQVVCSIANSKELDAEMRVLAQQLKNEKASGTNKARLLGMMKNAIEKFNNKAKLSLSENSEDEFQKNIGFKGQKGLQFILPPLKRGYFGWADILLKNTHDLNQKMLKQGLSKKQIEAGKQAYGFINQKFSSFKSDILLYTSPQSMLKELDIGRLQFKFQKNPGQILNNPLVTDLFNATNEILSNPTALGTMLDEYFVDTLIHPKEVFDLTDFVVYARLNAIKKALKKFKTVGFKLSKEAEEMSQVVYKDFLSDRGGSLTRYLQARNKKK